MLSSSVFTKLCILICFFIMKTYCFEKNLGSMRMRNFKASKCVINDDYLVTLENVKLDIGNNSQINLSGSIFVKTDLKTPLQAELKLFYKESVTVPVPCIENIGTCYYSDLCSCGYPSEANCPTHFQEDAVPCRCPIVKGNYTLSPSYQLSSIHNDGDLFLPGAYSGQLNVTTSSEEISCYTFVFDLYDSQDTNNIEEE